MNVNVNFMVKNVIQIKFGITANVNASARKNVCEKGYIWNPTACSCENGRYAGSIIDSSIICDKIIQKQQNEL